MWHREIETYKELRNITNVSIGITSLVLKLICLVETLSVVIDLNLPSSGGAPWPKPSHLLYGFAVTFPLGAYSSNLQEAMCYIASNVFYELNYLSGISGSLIKISHGSVCFHKNIIHECLPYGGKWKSVTPPPLTSLLKLWWLLGLKLDKYRHLKEIKKKCPVRFTANHLKFLSSIVIQRKLS